MARPLILVSNDDGVGAAGIRTLARAMRAIGEVVVVAPANEQSAASHSFTLHRPLRHQIVEPGVHVVDGTPVDCVYVACCREGLLSRKPDLAVSGINDGYNLGSDVFYSGTIAAAREAAMRGIPSIAFSLARHGGDLEEAAIVCDALARALLAAPRDPGPAPLLSVNIPPGRPKGIVATRLGARAWEDRVHVRHDPRGREYLWLGGVGVSSEMVEGADTHAIENGLVAVAPLRLELTEPTHLELAKSLSSPSKGPVVTPPRPPEEGSE
ncbi:MAG: 5'/3'-nucleotidase SurE [Deltaproteobacteria bacterium]|nr:5'/3'-nucleotidase SurE [Deltaproteobacteria bacterium]